MRHGNHPADNVNWVDAAAFCHWLSDRTQLAIALPTEFQWQLAATDGNPGKVYPWSDPVDPRWDPLEQPWRANTLESELGRSTAVGMYPTGASTGGVMDMAGTIYEWCRNAFDNPDNAQFAMSQDDQRVLRGGSWDDYAAHARSTFRLWYLPGYRYAFIGFRVVCLSPLSDTND